MAKTDLTAQQVRDALDYDHDTGSLTWRQTERRTKFSGKPAGHVDKFQGPRIMVRLRGRLYYAHRLAWLHYYGEHPKGEIDHIDGNAANNRISNLRDVSHTVNMQNRRRAASNNGTGILGVHRHQNSTKFRARVAVGGKEHHLGLFETFEEASAAYIEAKRKLHEGCTL